MRAGSLEDLQVFRSAMEAAGLVAGLDSVALRRDGALYRQLLAASGSVPAQIAEGYGQQSDRHFAHYLYIARGGCNEVRAHLGVARLRGYIPEPAHADISAAYVRVGKMLTRLIQHLERSDWKHRG